MATVLIVTVIIIKTITAFLFTFDGTIITVIVSVVIPLIMKADPL